MKTLIAILILLTLAACGRVDSPCNNMVDPNDSHYDPRCG